MRHNRISVVFVAVHASLFAAPKAGAQLIPSPNGKTVYDVTLSVTWLANANLAGTAAGKFGVGTIGPKGSMDYLTALQWVDSLNSGNGGAGYLGHNTWTLPTQPVFPAKDSSCSSNGPPPFRDSFGFGCTGSDMGSLFNVSFHIPYPNTAVPIPDTPIGPFHNFQPYLYWTHTSDIDGNKGHHTFSFNTGWAGSNVDKHYMYALPMIKGQVPGSYLPAGVGTLWVRSDGRMVYDPTTQVTWLADADLAKTEWFHAQCQNSDGTLCITADGSMQDSTAENWIAGMNATGYLGQNSWQLPPDPGRCGNFGCADTPLGNLYYNQLGLGQGTPVVDAPDIALHGFNHLQPYLYWACGAPSTIPPCQNSIPAAGFGGSFSFGNGFEGTDLQMNQLYVMAYFPQSPADALREAIGQALAASPELHAFLSQADDLSSAPNANAKAGMLAAFTNHVNAQRGKALTSAEADQLIALARAV